MKPAIQIATVETIRELRDLLAVFEEVFEMKPFAPPNDAYLQGLLERDTFFAVVASVNKQIVAGLTVYVLPQYYAERPLAYLYDLAVLGDYQRQGIGRELLRYTTSYCSQNGFEELFVQADKVDAYALDFYRSTNPTNEEQVVHFSYALKDAGDKSNIP